MKCEKNVVMSWFHCKSNKTIDEFMDIWGSAFLLIIRGCSILIQRKFLRKGVLSGSRKGVHYKYMMSAPILIRFLRRSGIIKILKIGI